MLNVKYITENGWPRCDSDDCERLPIPGTDIVIPLRKGDADIILRAWCAWFHCNVESLKNDWWPDEGGWTPTNSVASSNHLSGTAVDLNWKDHPLHEYTFNSQQIAQIRWGQNLFDYCIWWGADWESPHDEMHFQLNYPPNDPRIASLAKRLREGYLGIYKEEEEDMTPEQDKMLRELHQALCAPVISTARYKNDGEGAVWTRAQLISNDDGIIYDDAVEKQALLGNLDCINLIVRQANRGDVWAKTILEKIPKSYFQVPENQ